MLVEGVAYLIDGLSLGDIEFPVLPGLRFKEKADFAGRVKEVFAEAMGALACLPIEDGDLLGCGFKVVNEAINLVNGLLARLRGEELRDECVAMLFEMLCSSLDLCSLHSF